MRTTDQVRRKNGGENTARTRSTSEEAGRSTAYERWIDRVRICTAVVFAISGSALVVCANLRLGFAGAACGLVAMVSLFVVVGLIAEQIITAWIINGRARMNLGAVLLTTAALGSVFAVWRYSLGLALALLAFLVVAIAIAFEGTRARKPKSKDEADESENLPR